MFHHDTYWEAARGNKFSHTASLLLQVSTTKMHKILHLMNVYHHVNDTFCCQDLLFDGEK
jgi:hypothetical protein